MADIDYQNLLNLITGLPPNADEAQKKNVLLQVSTALIDGGEPDIRLRLRAIATRASLQYAQNVDMEGWIRVDLEDYIRDLQEKGAVIQPNNQPVDQDVNMAMDGGRKRRRGKKTKKVKKSRRYTRRR
jgi:hypothetical protein